MHIGLYIILIPVLRIENSNMGEAGEEIENLSKQCTTVKLHMHRFNYVLNNFNFDIKKMSLTVPQNGCHWNELGNRQSQNRKSTEI